MRPSVHMHVLDLWVGGRKKGIVHYNYESYLGEWGRSFTCKKLSPGNGQFFPVSCVINISFGLLLQT